MPMTLAQVLAKQSAEISALQTAGGKAAANEGREFLSLLHSGLDSSDNAAIDILRRVAATIEPLTANCQACEGKCEANGDLCQRCHGTGNDPLGPPPHPGAVILGRAIFHLERRRRHGIQLR